MKIHESITREDVIHAVEADDNLGFCVSCGTEVSGVEPDARKYKCDVCGEEAVYGAEILLLLTLHTVELHKAKIRQLFQRA
jgi:predicted RNA-binding Zn-ribbon protein involved in translation (DUF1610 family)